MALEREPVYTSAIASGATSGISLAALHGPIKVILRSMGAGDELADALVTILMVIAPVLISLAGAWWARKRTVTTERANDRIEVAALMPTGTSSEIEDLKFK
jgi:hypothetical protein